MQLFFKPMAIFAQSPVWALFVGIVLVGCYFLRRAMLKRRGFARPDVVAIGGALMWVVFFPYELRMNAWERAVIAPIRLDLLLIAPVLYVAAITSFIVTTKLKRD